MRAVDGSGTPDPTPLSYEWTIVAPDITAPETTIVTGPPASTTFTSAIFTFSADEFGAVFECALDDDQFGDCESPHVVSDLELGAHTLQVRAVDLAGNTDDLPGDVDMDGRRRHHGPRHRDHCRPVRAERVVERLVRVHR